MRPYPHRTVAGQLLEPGGERGAHALPAVQRMDDELALRLVVPALEPGVAGDVAVRGRGQQVTSAVRTAVAQPQLALLRHRPHAVGGRRGPQHAEDGGDVGGVEAREVPYLPGSGQRSPRTSSGSSAGSASRAAAAAASATCWSSL